MGCSSSKLDDEEVVQLCKDRRNFIKQAVDHRLQFALTHIAYIQSLKRVTSSLRDYVGADADESGSMLMLDSAYITPSPYAKSIQSKSYSAPPKVSQLSSSSVRIDFFKPRGNPSLIVEERSVSPETARVERYSSPVHQYNDSYEGFFHAQPASSSSFFTSSPPDERRNMNMPPPSPQVSQWDFFWNPFSSLDYDYYQTSASYDEGPMAVDDDDDLGLRKVREEEGIPELEEESEHEELPNIVPKREGYKEEVLVEDVDDEDSNEDDTDTDDEEEQCTFNEEDDDEDEEECVTESEFETELELQEPPHPQPVKSKEVYQTRDMRGQVKISQERAASREIETMKEEKPAGFTVYVNRRPTSMWEVVRDLEEQFAVICKVADEVSVTLDASRAQYTSSTSHDLTAMKLLNPVSLLRSASSRSASSRYLTNSAFSREDGFGSSSHFFESSVFGSHQSTMERLYAWEKKLYEEVRTGERLRMTYEKKCVLLRKQDVKGEGDAVMDKTRAVIRNLHTQIKVSMHTVEAISKRIRVLTIEELQPQVQNLVHGLSKMWKVMAECHQLQKRTLDEAKLLLAAGSGGGGTCSKNYNAVTSSALKLENELKNWRSSFESWIISQRSYAKSMAGWVLRCLRCDADSFARAPFSPRRSAGVPIIFGICIQWSKLLDSIPEVKVVDGLEFFAAGVGSVYAQQMREESRRMSSGSRRFGHSAGGGGMLEVGFVEDEDELFMNPKKMAELSMKVLCAGMSVAVSSLKEFALVSSEGYAALIKQSENLPN